MENIIWVVLLCAVLALLFAAWKTSAVSKADAGTERMKEIAGNISDGARAFLFAEYKILVIFVSLFSAACSRRHPFSRSYGVILPSSLTMLPPPALGFSPHPPVSVYGTGTVYTIAAFLDRWSVCFATFVRSA